MSVEPRRIALITSQAFSIINFRRELVRAWCAAGHEVHALAPDYDPVLREQVRALGARPVDYPLSRAGRNPFADLGGMFALASRLRAIRPDVVFAYFMKPVIYGLLAARLTGCARRYAMIEGTGYVFAEQPGLRHRALRTLTETLLRHALQDAGRVLFLNDADRALFVERRLTTPEQALLLGPIGVDLHHYTARPAPTSPVTFLLVARMLRAKGVADFVAAARILHDRHPGTRFVLVGGPDQNPASHSREELQAWQDEGVVRWQDHVDDIRPWLHEASVLVLPTYYREGVPRSIQEAMACARPVITTDIPGCRDVVIDGENGFLVPPRDVPALTAAMERFISQPALLETLGRQARAHAERHFDANAIVRRTSDALDLPLPSP